MAMPKKMMPGMPPKGTKKPLPPTKKGKKRNVALAKALLTGGY